MFSLFFHVEEAYEMFNHKKATLQNDICILKFNQMQLTKYAARACLPSAGDHPPKGTKCWTAGWGKIADDWNSPTSRHG